MKYNISRKYPNVKKCRIIKKNSFTEKEKKIQQKYFDKYLKKTNRNARNYEFLRTKKYKINSKSAKIDNRIKIIDFSTSPIRMISSTAIKNNYDNNVATESVGKVTLNSTLLLRHVLAQRKNKLSKKLLNNSKKLNKVIKSNEKYKTYYKHLYQDNKFIKSSFIKRQIQKRALLLNFSFRKNLIKMKQYIKSIPLKLIMFFPKLFFSIFSSLFAFIIPIILILAVVIGISMFTHYDKETKNNKNIQSKNALIMKTDIGEVVNPTTGIITSYFGERLDPIDETPSYHWGLDVANQLGTDIISFKDGTVIYADWYGGYGNLIIIDHGNGLETRYAHLSNFLVSEGQIVKRGQVIAAMGSTGYSTGPHLHFEIRINGEAIDPLIYVKY